MLIANNQELLSSRPIHPNEFVKIPTKSYVHPLNGFDMPSPYTKIAIPVSRSCGLWFVAMDMLFCTSIPCDQCQAAHHSSQPAESTDRHEPLQVVMGDGLTGVLPPSRKHKKSLRLIWWVQVWLNMTCHPQPENVAMMAENQGNPCNMAPPLRN